MRKQTTLAVTGVLGMVALVLAACMPPPSQPGYKSLIVGLVDKGSELPFHLAQPYPVIDLSQVASEAPGLTGTVVDISWGQLEPAPGTFDFSTLDASLAAVDAYNTAHPGSPLTVKLRVWGANDAPEWAKTLDGAPITETVNGLTSTVGQWWKPDYRAAWAGLQQALAQRYDDNPVVHEVVVASCASLTDEPFVMASGPALVPTLLADGWSDAAQQACLDGALGDYAPWHHTAVYYPFNPFKTISSPGVVGTDLGVTDEVMQRCAASVDSGGPWCILGNNAISAPAAQPPGSLAVYSEIDALWNADQSGTPIAFQLNSPAAADQCAAVAAAVSHHAQSVELWPPTGGNLGFTGETPSTLSAWSHALATGTPPTCPA